MEFVSYIMHKKHKSPFNKYDLGWCGIYLYAGFERSRFFPWQDHGIWTVSTALHVMYGMLVLESRLESRLSMLIEMAKM